MTTETLTTFFVLVSLLCVAGTILIAVGGAVLALTGGPAWLAGARADLGRVALRLAPLVAGGATLGSLYYSEVAGYLPCTLCWGQRIFMYSLAVVLTVGALRNDVGVRAYGLALAIPGAALAIYHSWLQAFPRVTSFCTTDAPCAERHVWEFGFVSIPFMALSAFLFVIALLVVAVPGGTGPATAGSMSTGNASSGDSGGLGADGVGGHLSDVSSDDPSDDPSDKEFA